jgi:homoserine dehydrogenase
MSARVHNGKVAVVGAGPWAGVVAGKLRGLGAQVAVLADIDASLPAYLGVVEAAGGMAPAFEIAMTALGRGLPVVSASPLLAGVHGQVLLAAARAQGVGLGLSGALLGALPAAALGAWPADEMILLSGGAAARVLSRIADRGQRFEVAARAESDSDTADLGGKLTLCRALALHGLWRGRWLNPGAARRVEVGQVTVERAAQVRRGGYVWRFGALLRPEEIYVGPLALGAEEPLAARQGLVVQAGAVTLEIDADERARALAGMVQDVRALLAAQLTLPVTADSAPLAVRSAQERETVALAEGVEIPAIGRAAAGGLRVAA